MTWTRGMWAGLALAACVGATPALAQAPVAVRVEDQAMFDAALAGVREESVRLAALLRRPRVNVDDGAPLDAAAERLARHAAVVAACADRAGLAGPAEAARRLSAFAISAPPRLRAEGADVTALAERLEALASVTVGASTKARP